MDIGVTASPRFANHVFFKLEINHFLIMKLYGMRYQDLLVVQQKQLQIIQQ
jgi:hypothetical protein